MPQLLVRNLDNEIVRHLKQRAGEHGVSVEEEHRRILRDALQTDHAAKRQRFWQALSDMPNAGEDALFERDRELPSRHTEAQLLDI
jgi:plasmid stability protein